MIFGVLVESDKKMKIEHYFMCKCAVRAGGGSIKSLRDLKGRPSGLPLSEAKGFGYGAAAQTKNFRPATLKVHLLVL